LLALARGWPAWASWSHDATAAAHEQVRAAADADVFIASDRVAAESLRAREGDEAGLAPALVPGRDLPAATAALASLVSGAATTAGLTLGAVQLLPPADTGRQRVFARVRVRADATGDVSELTTFLSALEGGAMRLTISELTVTQPDPAGAPGRAEALRTEFTVEGLAQR
jgi:hypothetical protein